MDNLTTSLNNTYALLVTLTTKTQFEASLKEYNPNNDILRPITGMGKWLITTGNGFSVAVRVKAHCIGSYPRSPVLDACGGLLFRGWGGGCPTYKRDWARNDIVTL